MKNDTLAFISTHIINKAVISEYKKLAKSGGVDCMLAIDTTNLSLGQNAEGGGL